MTASRADSLMSRLLLVKPAARSAEQRRGRDGAQS